VTFEDADGSDIHGLDDAAAADGAVRALQSTHASRKRIHAHTTYTVSLVSVTPRPTDDHDDTLARQCRDAPNLCHSPCRRCSYDHQRHTYHRAHTSRRCSKRSVIARAATPPDGGSPTRASSSLTSLQCA
jgi:hypothetical protein